MTTIAYYFDDPANDTTKVTVTFVINNYDGTAVEYQRDVNAVFNENGYDRALTTIRVEEVKRGLEVKLMTTNSIIITSPEEVVV